MPPNVFLIVLDTARADVFEPYGAPPGATPAVADIGRRGSVARSAYSTCNWTMPAHVSLFTGLLPRTLGLCKAPGGVGANVRPVLERNADRLLADVLRRAGYQTRAVSSNPWIRPYSGFATGFDEFHYADTKRRRKIHDPSMKARIAWAFEAVSAHVDDGATDAERIVRTWFDQPRDRPFFWFVNLIECHSPYLPPRPYNDLGLRARLRAAEEARSYLTLHGILRACAGRFEIPDAALERMRYLYRREIKMLDDWIGRVLGDMDARGMLDDTLVVVTSDHGENLGEGKLMGHAFSLDERLIRVPLVAMGPGADSFETAFSVAAVPGLIGGTVGLEHNPWSSDEHDPGVAVAQYDAMTEEGDPRLQMIRGWGIDDAGVRRFTTGRTCATDGRWKVEHFGTETRVYDLVADPLELAPKPLDRSTNGELRRLTDALERARASEHQVQADPEASDPDDIEERMRLLGYL